MLADYEELTSYLLGHELISAERIVAGDLTILDVSRRHASYEVVTDGGPSYFLKQDVRDGPAAAGEASIATVSHEASVYRMFARARRATVLRRYLPRCYRFDPAERLLVLESVRGSRNLAQHHLSSGRFSSAVARELGKAVGILHAAFRAGSGETEEIRRLPANPPWVFGLPWPTLQLYLASSGGNREFLKIVQASGDLATRFDELGTEWRADTLIHGDLKWSNCLVVTVARSAARRRARIRLVDWELACRGDASWDVGGLFSEYLNLWLSAIPISGDEPPDRFLDLARFQLPSMWPSIRAFWTAYVQATRLAPRDAAERLVRAVRYSAARLVQTAYEQLQDQSTVTNGAIYRLQLCHNILERPEEAAVQLLGLPVPETPRGD